MVPSWSVTMRCTMARPRPVPWALVEKKASKIGASGLGSPGPSSSTSMQGVARRASRAQDDAPAAGRRHRLDRVLAAGSRAPARIFPSSSARTMSVRPKSVTSSACTAAASSARTSTARWHDLVERRRPELGRRGRAKSRNSLTSSDRRWISSPMNRAVSSASAPFPARSRARSRKVTWRSAPLSGLRISWARPAASVPTAASFSLRSVRCDSACSSVTSCPIAKARPRRRR